MTDATLQTGRANGFLLSTAFLDAAAFGMILPVLPALIASLTGEGMGRRRWKAGG